MGPNDVLVELQRADAVGLELVLESDGVRVPVEPSFWSDVRVVHASGRMGFLSLGLTGQAGAPGAAYEVSSATYSLDGPGSYTLELPPLEGYEPLDPVVVDVTGSRAVATLELSPRP